MTPFVDTTDNVIEQSGNTLVEVITLGEAIVATNRCTNFAGAQKVTMTAIIAATHVTATGNRVHSAAGPSLAIKFSHALSAVGNMTVGGALILPTTGTAVQAPSPYPSFNASA